MGISPLWTVMAVGYVLTVLIETPILWLGLSRRHTVSIRAFAGMWLTACTYPVVILLLPALIDPAGSRVLYLCLAETFAPVAECLLFWLAFHHREARQRPAIVRDCVAITLANLASFTLGVVLNQSGAFEALLGYLRQ